MPDESILIKNESILFQTKASDQWAYYQAKGIKKIILEQTYGKKVDIDKYAADQADIQKQATELEKQSQDNREKSDLLFEKHHKMALATTLLQIAIALAAISALTRRKSFWIFASVLSAVGVVIAMWGYFYI